ncbi:uroporphyrinogen decarboxylase family protein [Hominenteromicrobium sp.]
MTSWERFKRMYEHREADRIPIIDEPWSGTLRRWRREGMPEGMDWCDYFDVDKLGIINIDISPRMPEITLEETDRYYIRTSPWGVTMKHFKEEDSTPEFLDFTITTQEAWDQAKKQMTLEDDRIPWEMLRQNYDKWRAEGRWIRAVFWFGFDVTHSWMMGTENTLIAMMEEPELVEDMFDTYLSRCETLFSRIWDAGYHFAEIFWYDDMGYKGTTFFSPNMYRRMLQPYHKRAVDWAHNRGIYAQLHSCGDVMTLLPDIVATGVDALNPLEVKAGMDAFKIKKEYGDRLVLHGGINAVLWNDKDAILEEIDRKVPVLKENGGFIFSSDHSIPNSVSLENMKAIVEEVKRVGRY